jgi:hypothetical protein
VRQLSVLSPNEVDGWRSPQKPEGPSGHRCEDWTRRKELLFPDAGIVVRDRMIPPDTRLAGRVSVLRPELAETNIWRLTRGPSYEGFGRRPFADGGTGAGAGVRKPPKEETAGRLGTVWRARLWGFVSGGRSSSKALATGGGGCFRLKRRRAASSTAAMRGSEGFRLVEGGVRWSRGHCGRVPARGWRRRRLTVRGGMCGDGHEVSIVIRLGDGEGQGRGPSKVSMMTIRPPQQGQGRAGETSSV